MPIRLKSMLIIFVIIFLLFIFYKVKAKKINLNYSLLWILMIFLTIFCLCDERVLYFLALLLGIKKISYMIFLCGFVVLIILTFMLTSIVSVQNKKINCLIQELAILKKEVLKEKQYEKRSKKI